eukprot:IDg21795t1
MRQSEYEIGKAIARVKRRRMLLLQHFAIGAPYSSCTLRSEEADSKEIDLINTARASSNCFAVSSHATV